MMDEQKKKRMETRRRRLQEMMKDGGRTPIKVVKRRKSRKPPPQNGDIKGTIQNYFPNTSIGGKPEMTLSRKRKEVKMCDTMVVENRTDKKPKTSMDPDSDDSGGGPNSYVMKNEFNLM